MYMYMLFTVDFALELFCLSESMNMSTSIHELSILMSIFSLSCPPAQHTSIVHVLRCPRQTQTSFRPEDHTDGERAPPSYDLNS